MTAATLVLVDPRSAVVPDPPYLRYHSEGLDWSITVPAFAWPAGTDGFFYELDLLFEDPDNPGTYFAASFGCDVAADPSVVTGGFSFTSGGSLPAGIDWVDVYGSPSLDDSFFPNGIIYDGGYSTAFEAPVTVTIGAGSDVSWGPPFEFPEDVRPITVQVYEQDNVTPVGALSSDRGREWLDDLSQLGSYTIESKLDHTDEALLTDTRVLRFCINEVPQWAGLVGPKNITIADPNGRKSGRVIGAAGPGLLAIFEDAVVLPELGFGRISPDTRYFGWMSRYYDHDGWGNAVELKQQKDPDDSKPWYGAPKGWPDPDAYWVGPTDGDIPGADPGGGVPGDIYFWGEYTVPEDEGGDYTASTTSDDAWELFKDGDREGGESRVALWGVTRDLPMQLDEGPHFFGYKLTNFDRPNNATNVTGMILSLAKMLGGGVARGDVVARSSSGTKMLALPESEPGMTAGHIVLVNVAENQALDWHPDLTCDFDEVYDTDGVEWPVELNVSYPVGSSMGDMLRHLTDSGFAEFAMDPVGKVLHAYVKKGTDRTAEGEGQVVVSYAENVSKLAMSHVGPGKNSGVCRTAEGRWVLFEDTAAVTAYGRRLVGLSLGSAPSLAAAQTQATAVLSDTANPVDAHTDLQVEDEVFWNGTVKTGDLVVGPLVSGSDVFRVHGLRFSEDAASKPKVNPELVREES